MLYNDDFFVKLLAGEEVVVDRLKFSPLFLRDIKRIGFKNYETYMAFATLDLRDNKNAKELLETLNELEVFLLFVSLNEQFELQFLEAYSALLKKELYYNKQQQLLYFVDGDGEPIVVTLQLWKDLHNFLKAQIGVTEIEPKDTAADSRTRELLKKREEMRRRVARQKSGGEDFNITLLGMISAYCAKNTNGINIFNVWDMTLYAFYDQLQKIQQIEKYTIDIDAILAGADSEKIELQHWLVSKQ